MRPSCAADVGKPAVQKLVMLGLCQRLALGRNCPRLGVKPAEIAIREGRSPLFSRESPISCQRRISRYRPLRQRLSGVGRRTGPADNPMKNDIRGMSGNGATLVAARRLLLTMPASFLQRPQCRARAARTNRDLVAEFVLIRHSHFKLMVLVRSRYSSAIYLLGAADQFAFLVCRSQAFFLRRCDKIRRRKRFARH